MSIRLEFIAPAYLTGPPAIANETESSTRHIAGYVTTTAAIRHQLVRIHNYTKYISILLQCAHFGSRIAPYTKFTGIEPPLKVGT